MTKVTVLITSFIRLIWMINFFFLFLFSNKLICFIEIIWLASCLSNNILLIKLNQKQFKIQTPKKNPLKIKWQNKN